MGGLGGIGGPILILSYRLDQDEGCIFNLSRDSLVLGCCFCEGYIRG